MVPPPIPGPVSFYGASKDIYSWANQKLKSPPREWENSKYEVRRARDVIEDRYKAIDTHGEQYTAKEAFRVGVAVGRAEYALQAAERDTDLRNTKPKGKGERWKFNTGKMKDHTTYIVRERQLAEKARDAAERNAAARHRGLVCTPENNYCRQSAARHGTTPPVRYVSSRDHTGYAREDAGYYSGEEGEERYY
jgi:hypothetical protein